MVIQLQMLMPFINHFNRVASLKDVAAMLASNSG
jgi:hypothetical protein